MSSAVVSTSAALGRPFVFDATHDAPVGTAALGCPVEQGSTATHAAHSLPGVARRDSRRQLSPHEHLIQSTHNRRFPSASITPASQLEIRPSPEMVSSGISALDALTGGLPRGCLTEICGPASSGRTTVLLAALAAATRRGEFCAVVDASDALDPHSATAAGVDLDQLLWVRCGEHHENQKDGCRQSEHRLEQVLRATDLLLESGGFGLIVLDLSDLPPQSARRIPLTTWFRFRRAVEHKPTILLAIEQQPIAGSCSSLLLQLGTADTPAAERRKNAAHGPSASLRVNSSRGLAVPSEQAPEGRKKICTPGELLLECLNPTHAQLLTGLQITAELIRSRLDRKPARSVMFDTKTAWAG